MRVDYGTGKGAPGMDKFSGPDHDVCKLSHKHNAQLIVAPPLVPVLGIVK